MKLLCIATYFLVLLYSGAKGDTIEDISHILTKCYEEYPISDDEFTTLINEVHPYNEKTKCFEKCIAEELGWFKDGVLMSNVVVPTLSHDFSLNEDVVRQFTQECRTLVGSSRCDTVYRISQCLHTKVHKL
uniref:Uncharacterized protein n=1 Tax=Stomoxys calcitrans TaxID=35570 RepID=A0A2Y9D4P9_STOCA